MDLTLTAAVAIGALACPLIALWGTRRGHTQVSCCVPTRRANEAERRGNSRR